MDDSLSVDDTRTGLDLRHPKALSQLFNVACNLAAKLRGKGMGTQS